MTYIVSSGTLNPTIPIPCISNLSTSYLWLFGRQFLALVLCLISVSLIYPINLISINPLMGTGNYSATSNNMKLAHWPLMGGLLHLVQQGGDWAGPQPTQALLALPNVTVPESTHQRPVCVPVTVLLYNGPLLCTII